MYVHIIMYMYTIYCTCTQSYGAMCNSLMHVCAPSSAVNYTHNVILTHADAGGQYVHMLCSYED